MSELGEFALFLSVGFGSLGFFFGPVGKALGRWIESWGRRRDTGPELLEIEARLAELEASCVRLQELEERLDFAERVLTRQGQPRRLEGQA